MKILPIDLLRCQLCED